MAILLEEKIRDVNIDKGNIHRRKKLTFVNFALLSLCFELQILTDLSMSVKNMYTIPSHKYYSTFLNILPLVFNKNTTYFILCKINLSVSFQFIKPCINQSHIFSSGILIFFLMYLICSTMLSFTHI